MRKSKRRINITSYIIEHIRKNVNEYIIMIGLFFIGCLIGVIIINNMDNTQKQSISQYITQYSSQINNNINYINMLLIDCKNNLIMCVILWICATIVIGIPIIYINMIYRGLCIGYTIAATIGTFGTIKGSIFSICAMLLHNIIIIPCILILSINSIHVYRKVIKDKQRNNIKQELLKHAIITTIIFLILSLSSFIKVFISFNLLSGYISISRINRAVI